MGPYNATLRSLKTPSPRRSSSFRSKRLPAKQHLDRIHASGQNLKSWYWQAQDRQHTFPRNIISWPDRQDHSVGRRRKTRKVTRQREALRMTLEVTARPSNSCFSKLWSHLGREISRCDCRQAGAASKGESLTCSTKLSR